MSGTLNDMYADGVLSVILQVQREFLAGQFIDHLKSNLMYDTPRSIEDLLPLLPTNYNKCHLERNLYETYKDIFGENAVEYHKKEKIVIKVYENTITINLNSLSIECSDENLEHIVSIVVEQCTNLLNFSLKNNNF